MTDFFETLLWDVFSLIAAGFTTAFATMFIAIGAALAIATVWAIGYGIYWLFVL